LTTGDHKRLGLLYAAGGVIALLAAAISSAIYFAAADGPQVWTAIDSRLASSVTVLALVIGIPALWIGVATYVVPLQIGATRLALPRLHNLALWTYFGGGVLVSIGLLAGRANVNSLAASAPAAATEGARATRVTELLLAGLFVVGLALLLAAVSLLVTVLNRRAEGLRLAFMPLFGWSTLATSSVLVLAMPVFLAGVALVAYDQHYGGTLFAAAGGKAGLRIWEHELWIGGHPLGLLFAAAAVGILGDIVATHARRPLVGFSIARAAAAAAPALTLLLWAGNLSVLFSPFAPVATLGALLVGAPLGLSLLTWLGTLKGAKPRFHSSLLFVVSFLALVGLATALSVAGAFRHMTNAEADAFRNGQFSLLVFGAPLLALGAAIAHWTPKMFGRSTPAGAAALQCLLFVGGAVLMAAPGYLVGLGAGTGVTKIGIAGAAMIAVGLLVFAASAAGRSAEPAVDDPYGGMTLEWATASPPPPYNFESIPDIRSPYPLADPGAAL